MLLPSRAQDVVDTPPEAPEQVSKPATVVEGVVSDPPGVLAEKTLISVMACVLEQLVSRNDKIPFDASTATIFHGSRPANITIKAYLQRIYKCTNVSGGCLVVSLLYIDRFMERNKAILLTSQNVHRIIITSVVLAMKFLDDLYYTNAYYAKISGIPCAEMNALELEFLFRIHFDLHAPVRTAVYGRLPSSYRRPTTPLQVEEYERYHRELSVHAQYACGCSCAQSLHSLHPPPKSTPLAAALAPKVRSPLENITRWASCAPSQFRAQRLDLQIGVENSWAAEQHPHARNDDTMWSNLAPFEV
jgi:hypothetical protein